MSIESVAIALHHTRAESAGTRMVLLGIANHNGDGGSWPSVKTLSEYANVQPRQVQKALLELEALGEVVREVQAGGLAKMASWDRPNLYHFRLTCPPHCDRSSSHRLLCERCGRELPKRPKTQVWRWHRDDDERCVRPSTDPPSWRTPGVVEDTRPPSWRTPKPSTNPTTHGTKESHLPNRACEKRQGRGHLIDQDTGECMACGLNPTTGTTLNENGTRA